MDSLIDSQGVPQAFIASSLPVLEGAIEALRTRTGTVPQHINIGTFDEHPMLGFLPNSVWSMQQDEDTWAEKAFELMQRAIDGEAVNETAKVDMKLVKRSRQ
jgi:LacI family sucrose operon transcriptional repressor